MILKNFLMSFGGIAAVTGVGIGVYYVTNSREDTRRDVETLALKNSEGDNKDSNLQDGGSDASLQPNTPKE